jgi:preprotein translocase subunit SecG
MTFIIGMQTSVLKFHLLFQVFVSVSPLVVYVLMDDSSGSGSSKNNSKSISSSSSIIITQNYSAEFYVKSVCFRILNIS